MSINQQRLAQLNKKLLQRFLCPITGRIMNDPVKVVITINTPDGIEKQGYTVEREAFVKRVVQAHAMGEKHISITINSEIVKFSIAQIVENDYELCLMPPEIQNGNLTAIKGNKVYLTVDGNYCLRTPAGAFKQGKIPSDKSGGNCNPTNINVKKYIFNTMLLHGYNMFMLDDLSKKNAINKFLSEYPRFYEGDFVYLPKSWKKRLHYLICTKNIQDEEEHLKQIIECLERDPRLLTAKLSKKYSAFYLACEYANPALVWFLFLKLKETNRISMVCKEWHKDIELKHANQLLRLLLSGNIKNCTEENFHLLLQLGVCIKQEDPITKNTLLHYMAAQGALNTDWLLSGRSDWQSPRVLETREELLAAINIDGNTPLHVCVQNEHATLAELLLLYEAQVNVINNLGDTPLHLAVQKQNIEITQILLNNNADVSIKNKRNETSISIECQKILKIPENNWHETEILKLLLKEQSQLLPLHLAIELEDYDLLFAMLKISKQYLEKSDDKYITPLHLAATKGDLNSVKLLVAHGVDLTNTAGELKQTVLHIIVNVDRNEILCYLCEENPDIIRKIINRKDIHGNTALHHAASLENKAAITMLINLGARLLCNQDGKVPKGMTENANIGRHIKNMIKERDASEQEYLKEQIAIQQQRITELESSNHPRPDVIFSDMTGAGTKKTSVLYSETWQRVLSNGCIAIYIDGIIKIYDPKTGQDAHAVDNHNKSPDCVLISCHGTLVSVGAEEKINIWQLKSEEIKCTQIIASFGGHSSAICSVHEIGSGKLVSYSPGEIKIWEGMQEQCLHTIMEEDLSILCFDGDNKSNLIVGGSATGKAYVWKLDAQVECIHQIPAKELGRMQFRGTSGIEDLISYVPVRCVKIVNPNLLAMGLNDGTINIFDLALETISYSLLAHSSSIQCVTVWNNLLVSCSADEIKTWSLDTFSCIDTIPSQDGKKFHLFLGENGINLVMQKDDVTEVFSLQDFIEKFRTFVNKVGTWLW